MSLKVLLLAGTAEARALAKVLSTDPRFAVTASLAGVTSKPDVLAVPTRTGGYGGADGLRNWLNENHISAVVNAVHPYAEQMQANALSATADLNLPHLRLLRAAWPPRPGWIHAPNIAEAVNLLPRGAKPLVTTGRKELAPFIARPDLACVLRTIEPVANLPPHIQPMIARPPFDPDQERATMALLGITHLLTKNAGGAGDAKLDAADALLLATLVVDRPPVPPGPVVQTVQDAVAWLCRRVAD